MIEKNENNGVELPKIQSDEVDLKLLMYLLGGPEVFGLEPPDYVDLEWCSPFFEVITSSNDLVPSFSEEDRIQERLDLREDIDISEIFPDEEDQETLLSYVESQQIPERELTLAYDPEDNMIVSGPLSRGRYTKVETSWHHVLYDMKVVPILNIHTHPDETPMSISDYGLLLAQYPAKSGEEDKARKRLFNGIMMLTPSIQFLAIATELTPVVPHGEVEAFIENEEVGIQSEFREEIQKLGVTNDNFFEVFKGSVRRNPGGFLEFVNELGPKMHKGEISPSMRRQGIRSFVSQTGLEEEQLARENERNESIKQRVWTNLLLGFAKENHIQIYTSLNMKGFSPFSLDYLTS